MAASGCLAGGTGSWALLWVAIQACHMVRQGQAVHALWASQLLPRHQRTIALYKAKGP